MIIFKDKNISFNKYIKKIFLTQNIRGAKIDQNS